MQIETVSIVTPSLNQDKFLARTIESVISQEGDFSLDYIVMDGGSSDQSVEIIKGYADLIETGRWETRCNRLSLRWFSEADKGTADAINKGILLARGEILGFLNSDDIYEPHALQRVVDEFKDDPKLDVLYGHALYIDTEGNIISAYPTEDIYKHNPLNACHICQPATFVTRECYEVAGPLRIDLVIFDYEYWLRLFSHGRKFKLVNEILARARNHVDTIRHNQRKRIVTEGLAITKTEQGYNARWRQLYTREISKVGRITSKISIICKRGINFVGIHAYSRLFVLLFPPK